MSAQRTRSAMLALAALSVILMAERAAAQAIVIDFSAIPIGTGLPPVAGPDNDINDFMPSGVTLASATPASVFIGEAGGNRFLVAALTGLGADALVNLGFEAETVAVDFISTPPGQIGLIDAFSAEQSPTSLDFGSFIGETIVTSGGTASFTAPFANIRAMLIEQS